MMSEGVETTVMSSEDSVATTTTTTTTKTTSTSTSTMTTPLERRDDSKKSSPTKISPSHTSHSHNPTAKTVKKHKKHVHTSEGTFIWIDGKKIRSALTHKKWPPRPRRVSFPINDVDLVTGYLEPANPWKHAENVNIEDVISSYKISCEHHRTMPLQNVINQLEKLEVTDDERCPEFCLKNELLDYRRCEPFEEIFKRVQFEKIDLEAASLDDESAVTLFDMFEYYESAKHLDISNNRDVGARGWQACAHMIKKTPCLETLEARDITLTQQHMNILKRPLQLVSHLHVLKLENCGLAGRAFVILVSALKMNTGLKELYLADNGLEQEDAIQLGALLRVNNHLQLLDISNNHIEDEGVRDLLDGLITQSGEDKTGKGLGILVLWNNDLTKHSSGHFTQTIAESTTLETLNIGKNSVSNELLEVAQDALINSRTLLQLGMQSTNITCKGALALAEIIERNRSLQRIDLRDNNIQMTGLTALSFAMKKNTSITQMDLDDTPWSKTPATMNQYLDLVALIRGYCARNDEPTSTEETTDDTSSSPQHRSRLSSVSSRKISLTCQTLPRSSSTSMNPHVNEITTRTMLEPNHQTSGGRLRSPAPSPIPSPVASPIPSPSRSRFVVSRVSETTHASPNVTAPSSPTTPPSSLASSPTCFFTPANVGSSRFRVVTIVEPPSNPEIPSKSVITNPNGNVTIGFHCDTDKTNITRANDQSTIVVATETNVETRELTSSTESNAGNVDVDSRNIDDDTKRPDESLQTMEIHRTDTDDVEISKMNDDQTSAVKDETPDCVEPTASTSKPEISSSDVEKDGERSKDPEIPEIHRVDDPEILRVESIDEKSTTIERSDDSFCNRRIFSFPSETKKSDSLPRQATSLERLLNLFQHPTSLFTGNTFAGNEGNAETKNPIQDGVNSMIALGDKFHQYFRDGSANSGNEKSGSVDSTSHGSLQRSASDASRSTEKIDRVKFLSQPQLSSIRATRVRNVSTRTNSTTDNTEIQHTEIQSKTSNATMRKIVNVEKSSFDDSTMEKVVTMKNCELSLPEDQIIVVEKNLECCGSSFTIAGDDSSSKSDVIDEIVNSASLNVASESRTAKSAQKLIDIPEHNIVDAKTTTTTMTMETDASGTIVMDEITSVNDKTDSMDVENVKIKCDSTTKNSINDPSFNETSLVNLNRDINVVECTNTMISTTNDVNNFFNAPLANDETTTKTIVERSNDDLDVMLVSSMDNDETLAMISSRETIVNVENSSTSNFCHSIDRNFSFVTNNRDNGISNDNEAEKICDSSLSNPMETITTNTSNLSSTMSNDSSTNVRVDERLKNNEKVDSIDEKFDETTFVSTINSSSDKSTMIIDVQQQNVESLTNDETNDNAFAIDETTATESIFTNVVNEFFDNKDFSCSTIESTANNEIPIDHPIAMIDRSSASSNEIDSTNTEETTNIRTESIDENSFVRATTNESTNRTIFDDSDRTSQLSVDDSQTSEISSNASTSNYSSTNNPIERTIHETSLTNDNYEILNNNREISSINSPDSRFIVHDSDVERISPWTTNICNIATTVSITKCNSIDESTINVEETTTIDDSTIRCSSMTNETMETTIDIDDSTRTTNLAYLLSPDGSTSSTNLYMEKSRRSHSNSQDSGIEESVTILSSEEMHFETIDNNERRSFQESVDSGIDSEGSSVCARVEVGADAQKERARDPGKTVAIGTSCVGPEMIIVENFTNVIVENTMDGIANDDDDNDLERIVETIGVETSNEITND